MLRPQALKGILYHIFGQESMGVHLALFFTYGVSLQGWHGNGTLTRDSRLYVELVRRGHAVTFVTYGGEGDAKLLPPEWGIRVLTRPDGLSARAYGRRIPFLHRDALQQVDVIKSHQINGARYALWSSLVLRKPFLARCGYLPSIQAEVMGFAPSRRWSIAWEEAISLRLAQRVSLVSPEERDHAIHRYGVKPGRIHLCPNWIDTDLFRPLPEAIRHPRRVITVGRLEAQKRPLMLVRALARAHAVELLVVGEGCLQGEMEQEARRLGVNMIFAGRVANEALPALLNSASLFVSATCFEGSPKAMLEAMACGLPVVTTAAPGIAGALRSGEHGTVVPMEDEEGLGRAVAQLLEDPVRACAMGDQARREVETTCAIGVAVAREEAMLGETLSTRGIR